MGKFNVEISVQMKKNLITTVMGASLLMGALTGCSSEDPMEPIGKKVYMPSKYQKEPNFDITPKELLKLSTPFYSELSSVDSLHAETLDMNQNAKEFERKEAERKHKEELERKRLAKLKLEEEKKKNQQKTVSRGEENKQGAWRTFNGSYYGADCYKCSGVTATGVNVKNSIYFGGYRIIATDPKIIPLWSIVEVVTPNETFKAIALDTGGRIKNMHVDILVGSERESINHGRHNVQIRIIGTMNH